MGWHFRVPVRGFPAFLVQQETHFLGRLCLLPFRVYGTQQDNTAISVPFPTHKGAIPWGDCYVVGNSESGHIAVHPDGPNTVISGAIGSSAGGGSNLLHYDHSTGQVRIITVWPELNTGWGRGHEAPLPMDLSHEVSPHDPATACLAATRYKLAATRPMLFRTTDYGQSWASITGSIPQDDYTRVVREGPLRPGLLYAGHQDRSVGVL